MKLVVSLGVALVFAPLLAGKPMLRASPSGGSSKLAERAASLEHGREPADFDDAAAMTWAAARSEREGRTADAVKLLDRSIDFVDRKVGESAGQLTSVIIEDVRRWAHQQEEVAYTICARHPTDAATIAFGARVARRRKARDLQWTAEALRRLRSAPATDPVRVDVEQAAEDLSTLTIYGFGDPDPKIAAATAGAEERLRQKERVFAARQVMGIAAPDLDLAPFSQGAIVDFVAYRELDFDSEPRWGDLKYGAFVTAFSIGALPPHFVSLGPAAAIDALAQRALRALQGDEAGAKEVTKYLYEKVMAPVRPFLTEPISGVVSTVVMVPDAGLSSVPFDALWNGSRWLADDFAIYYATSSRTWSLDSAGGAHGPHSEVTIIADPVMPPSGRVTGAIGGLGRLPGTRAEATAIAGMLPGAKLLTGDAANVAAVRAARPSILHIATHGFALATPPVPATAGSRGVLLQELDEAPPRLAASPLDPLGAMRRTALVLSGARAVREKGDRLVSGAKGVGDDGVLTAAEILALDLEGTQLVTLSACESANGDAVAGGGLFGLPRAFSASGAETVVGSLWAVDDRATADLMIRFYARLVRGRTRGEALLDAKRSLRRSFSEPRHWAPFVLVGAALSPLKGGDVSGAIPNASTDELPDTGPVIGVSPPPPSTHKRHMPALWATLDVRPRWEPLWESERGRRERNVVSWRGGDVNVWSFEEQSTLHTVVNAMVRKPDGTFVDLHDLDVVHRGFSRAAGAMTDVKRPTNDSVLVRAYEFPTVSSPGWLEVVELARDGSGAARVKRRYEGKFVDTKRPDWAR